MPLAASDQLAASTHNRHGSGHVQPRHLELPATPALPLLLLALISAFPVGHTRDASALVCILMHEPHACTAKASSAGCALHSPQPRNGGRFENILPVSSLCHSPPPSSCPPAPIADMGQNTCNRAIPRRRRHPLCHSCFSRSFRLFQAATLVTPLFSSARSYTSQLHMLPRLASLDASALSEATKWRQI